MLFQRLWRLVANIILTPSAEGHEKIECRDPSLRAYLLNFSLSVVPVEDQESSLCVGTHLPS